MKNISTLTKYSLLVIAFFFSIQVNGQVAGSFGIYTIPNRFGAKPLEHFKANGFETKANIMVESVITSDKYTANIPSIKAWLTKYYPDATSTGSLILDWESGPYDNLRDYPLGSSQFITAENELLKMIDEVKNYRPNVKISMYQMPYRVNSIQHNRLFNAPGKFDKIFAKLDFITSSVYIESPDEQVGHEKNLQFLKFNLDVALPLGKKYNKPVHFFVWHKVHPLNTTYGDEIIQKDVFAKYIKYIYAYSLNGTRASGAWWWDGVANKLADLSGINNHLQGTVTDEASYDNMIVDYAKHVKEVLTNTTEIITDTQAPLVTGVEANGIYNIDKRISFNEGTATLNNAEFNTNTLISAEGVYNLVVTDVAGNVTNVRFTMDKTKPTGTLLINNNAEVTNTTKVTLNLTSQGGAVEMRFINNSVWGSWEPIAPTKAWALTPGDGTKTASVQFRDAAGNISSSAYDKIALKLSAIITPVVTTTTPVVTTTTPVVTTTTPVVTTTTPTETTTTPVVTTPTETTTTPVVTTPVVTTPVVTTTTPVVTTPTVTTTTPVVTTPTETTTTPVVTTPTETTTTPTETTTTPVVTTTTPVVTTPTGTGPVVTGVADGGLYNTDKRIYFNKGTATLNNLPFNNSTLVTAEGVYTLVVTDTNKNVTTVRFTMDRTKPTGTLLINNNAEVTNTTNVMLNLTYQGDPVEMRFINNSVWGSWEPLATTKAWTLAIGDGTRTASVQFRDAAGNISTSAYDKIALKQLTSIIPTQPTAARKVQEVKQEVVSNNVTVYPNPATTKLHVEVSEAGTGETTINLLDMNGQVALTQKVTTTTSLTTVLDVDQLQPGVYVLSLNTPKGRTSKRIVVQ